MQERHAHDSQVRGTPEEMVDSFYMMTISPEDAAGTVPYEGIIITFAAHRMSRSSRQILYCYRSSSSLLFGLLPACAVSLKCPESAAL